MTKKKDLKRLVRRRMVESGERYTEALAQVLSARTTNETPAVPPPVARPSLIAHVPAAHDLTEIARAEGFDYPCWIHGPTWDQLAKEMASPEAWFQRIFERLRKVLVVSAGEPGADRLRAILTGKVIDDGAPEPPSIAFLQQIDDAGRRGVDPQGKQVVFDVERPDGAGSLVWMHLDRSGMMRSGMLRRPSLRVDIDPDLAWTRPEALTSAFVRFSKSVGR